MQFTLKYKSNGVKYKEIYATRGIALENFFHAVDSPDVDKITLIAERESNG